MKFQKSLTISILVVNGPILAKSISKRSVTSPCDEEFGVMGHCRALKPMFSWNKQKGKCEQFFYGGCGGNGNKFYSEEECNNTCLQISDEDVLNFSLFSRFTFANKYEPEDRCFHNKSRGKKGWDYGRKCQQSMRYYFNSAVEKCVLFSYYGCKGNGNNFMNREECEGACLKSKSMVNDAVEEEEEDEESVVEETEEEEIVDKCKQKTDMGRGRLALQRWSFNSFHKRCTRFVYFGDGGNQNKFLTEQECKNACVNLENRSGKYVYDVAEEEEEEREPEIVKNCSDKLYTGMCRAYIKRYGFNTTTGVCEQFVYGGCGENGNNYKSMEDCENKCHNKVMVSDVAEEEEEEQEEETSNQTSNIWKDEMQPNTGHLPSECQVKHRAYPCRASIPRYAYKHGKGCELFYWGGCDPNANNFKTMSDCRLKCTIVNDAVEEEEEEEEETIVTKPNLWKDTIQENTSHLPQACRVMYKSSPCRAAIQRYAYDAKLDRCKLFIWGGCQPNSNNFQSITDCRAKCEQSRSMLNDNSEEEEEEEETQEEESGISANNKRICSLPKKPGHKVCAKKYGKHYRFYFDANFGECKGFKYNGCQKNENHFYNKHACESFCRGMPEKLKSNSGLSHYNPFQSHDFKRFMFGKK